LKDESSHGGDRNRFPNNEGTEEQRNRSRGIKGENAENLDTEGPDPRRGVQIWEEKKRIFKSVEARIDREGERREGELANLNQVVEHKSTVAFIPRSSAAVRAKGGSLYVHPAALWGGTDSKSKIDSCTRN